MLFPSSFKVRAPMVVQQPQVQPQVQQVQPQVQPQAAVQTAQAAQMVAPGVQVRALGAQGFFSHWQVLDDLCIKLCDESSDWIRG